MFLFLSLEKVKFYFCDANFIRIKIVHFHMFSDINEFLTYEYQILYDDIDSFGGRNKCKVFFVFEWIIENYKTLNRCNDSTARDLNDSVFLESLR